jgi:glyoxylase-like metal-dependent hydrolase (beta-lactamase superfamily II)
MGCILLALGLVAVAGCGSASHRDTPPAAAPPASAGTGPGGPAAGSSVGSFASDNRLRARFTEAKLIYPGHGAPGTPAKLIDAQREYPRSFRALIRPALANSCPGGRNVTADEQRAISAELGRRYPNYPRMASLPNLAEINIHAVAAELLTEAANSTALPAACQP